ncbi:unnamed protein product [Larinioides sclopetarius]|uniref:Uncharacterized protein n=1 Tax=Larinioides sclopetarius TaxID=280406 RepID=A0AAV2B214_9ARAC
MEQERRHYTLSIGWLDPKDGPILSEKIKRQRDSAKKNRSQSELIVGMLLLDKAFFRRSEDTLEGEHCQELTIIKGISNKRSQDSEIKIQWTSCVQVKCGEMFMLVEVSKQRCSSWRVDRQRTGQPSPFGKAVIDKDQRALSSVKPIGVVIHLH